MGQVSRKRPRQQGTRVSARHQRRLRRPERLEDRRLLAITTPVLGSSNDIVFLGDGAVDSIDFFTTDSGLLQHTRGGLDGFESQFDLDAVTPGEQTRLIDDVVSFQFHDSGENDIVQLNGNPDPIRLNGAFSIRAGVVTTNGVVELTAGNEEIAFYAAGHMAVRQDARIATTGGNVTLEAGPDSNWNSLYLSAEISSQSGNIAILGRGGSDGQGIGVYLASASISSLGSGPDVGSIEITGIGGVGGGANFSHGVELVSSTVSSVDGDIRITGSSEGIGNSNGGHAGIVISNASVVESLGTTTTAAKITLDGEGGLGPTGNTGITVIDSTLVSRIGDIEISGRGRGTNPDARGSMGVKIRKGSQLLSTGTGPHAAEIKIEGTGGFGTRNNPGTRIAEPGTRISSIDGDISVIGYGGGIDIQNRGIHMVSGAIIESTGNTEHAAKITLDGTGTGDFDGTGILVLDAAITTDAGHIEMRGQGSDTGIDNSNQGVRLGRNAEVSSTGEGTFRGDITIAGIGGGGTHQNHGVQFGTDDGSSSVRSIDGDIIVSGVAGNGASEGDGIHIAYSANLTTVGEGTILLDGASQGVTTGRGVFVDELAHIMSLGGSDISVTGDGSGGQAAIEATGIFAVGGIAHLTATDGFIRQAGAHTDFAAENTFIDGQLSPSGPGANGQIQIVGNTIFASDDVYQVELNGQDPSESYDQLQVVGTNRHVELANSTLEVSLGFVPSLGDSFKIIDVVDTSSSVVGTFDGLPEGSQVLVDGVPLQITYAGGTDGNDVVLMVNERPSTPIDSDPLDNRVDEGATAGTTVGLTVSAIDPDGGSVSYRLIDDAGTRFQIDSESGVVTVQNGHLLDGPATHTVTVQAVDTLGGTTISSFDIDVENVSPELTSVTTNHPDPSSKSTDGNVSVEGFYFDPALESDTHTIEVDWGDGSPIETLPPDAVNQADDTFGGNHNYTAGGIFEIVVTVSDEDGGVSSQFKATAVVTGVGVQDGVLHVIGTSQADRVTIVQHGNDRLRIHADFLHHGRFVTLDNASEIDRIIAYLCEGDDKLTIAGNVDIPAIIHGGANNDRIQAGAGPSILIGNSGDDLLIGGLAADILIGGAGKDRLSGGTGGDALIGGKQQENIQDQVLMAMLVAWNDRSSSYRQRALELDSALEIVDDEEKDVLTGGAGRDVFFNGISDFLRDRRRYWELVL